MTNDTKQSNDKSISQYKDLARKFDKLPIHELIVKTEGGGIETIAGEDIAEYNKMVIQSYINYKTEHEARKAKKPFQPELTPNQQKTITAILTTRNYNEAIKKCPVSKSTFFLYLREPYFKSELRRQQEEIQRAALDYLKRNVGRASKELVSLLKAKSESVRLKAAQSILNYVALSESKEKFKFDYRGEYTY